MLVYLAARFPRRADMLARAGELHADGHVVTSRWVWGDEGLTDAQRAQDDIHDLSRAEVVVSFTEPPEVYSTGGRHVELGLALALRKRVVVVGHRENVFHHLPQIEFYDLWEMARAAL